MPFLGTETTDAVILLGRTVSISCVILRFLSLQSKENTWVRVTSSTDQTIKANKQRFPSHTYLIAHSEKRSCTPGNLQMRCPAFCCSATLSKPYWGRGGFLLVQTKALHSNCKIHIQDLFLAWLKNLAYYTTQLLRMILKWAETHYTKLSSSLLRPLLFLLSVKTPS